MMHVKIEVAVAFVLLVAGLSGCTSLGNISQMGPDTYSLSATSNFFGDADVLLERAQEAGDAFCAGRGRQFYVVDEQKSRVGARITVDVTFRCEKETPP